MNFCRNFSRGLLIFTNVLFMSLGGLLLYLGVYLKNDPQLEAFTYSGISHAVITCGVLVLFIAFLGCCGAQCDSKFFLCFYITLVLVSIAAQALLTVLMVYGHHDIKLLIQNDYDPSRLTKDNQYVFDWLRKHFFITYDNCAPLFELYLSSASRGIVLQCANPSYNWFTDLVNSFCAIAPQDLLPGSSFTRCTRGLHLDLSNISKQALFCSCETKLVNWLDDQLVLVGLLSGLIASFQVVIIILSCLVMCTKNHRRREYREIQMPLKRNPYPSHCDRKNYYYQNDQIQVGAYGQSQPLIHTQSSMNSIPVAQPVSYGVSDNFGKKI